MNLDLSTLASVISIGSALAAWAVIPWRVNQIELRVARLEESERDMTGRMIVIETELKLTRITVEKIATKLDA